MDRVFNSTAAAWKISFECLYRDLDMFDEYFIDIAQADAVSSYELSSQDVEPKPEDKWCFEAYFTTAPELHKLASGLNELSGNDYILTLVKIDDKDWVLEAQQNFTPIITEDFFISSDYYSNECPQHKQLIVMNPGRAFGTGDHATTRGCIESLYQLKQYEFKNIADIGCGTGVLGIVAAKCWPLATVSGCDIEEIAVEIANNNARINHGNIKFQYCDGKEYLANNTTNDLIIANILAQPLIDMANEIYHKSSPKSVVILSGFLLKQLPEVLETYTNLGFAAYNRLEHEGWVSLTLKK